MAVPTRPASPALNYYTFPNDLLSLESDRRFCTQIQMVEYQSSYATGTNMFTVPNGGVVLPMPKKINDRTIANWQAVSATQFATNLTPGILGGAASIVGGALGVTINPFLWQLFKGMNFKKHSFTWTLAPNTQAETVTVNNIINYLKSNMLPTANDWSPLMGYPLIALIKFYPDDIFGQFRFKPCAISAIDVDYTGAGGPSFFRNRAPTVVNLSIAFEEIEIWTRNNYYTGAAQLNPFNRL